MRRNNILFRFCFSDELLFDVPCQGLCLCLLLGDNERALRIVYRACFVFGDSIVEINYADILPRCKLR